MDKKSSLNNRVRAGIVCENKGEILLVRLKDPSSGVERLFPPGGEVREGESPRDAAVRETLEETGYQSDLDPDTELVFTYPYRWDDKNYLCTTHLFRGWLPNPQASPGPVRDADFNLGIEWVSRYELEQILDYHDQIRAAVISLVGRTKAKF